MLLRSYIRRTGRTLLPAGTAIPAGMIARCGPLAQPICKIVNFRVDKRLGSSTEGCETPAPLPPWQIGTVRPTQCANLTANRAEGRVIDPPLGSHVTVVDAWAGCPTSFGVGGTMISCQNCSHALIASPTSEDVGNPSR